MKAGLLLILFAVLFAGRVLAQEGGAMVVRTNSALTFETAVSPYLTESTESKGAEFKLGKKVRVSGPMVQLFHTKKVSETPKRFWHLINPFARSTPEPEIIRSRDLNPQAWSTTAGWHPGVSSITYSLTQPEGGAGIGLVSIGH